jgi:pimeloyl-ACP methyl ester carboxylesterase
MPHAPIDSEKEKLTLILIHGATCNSRMWDAVRRNLDRRFRVVALELPGHGARRNEKFTLHGAVATVVEAARAVMPSPVVLIGDSLGGYTAMASASSLPRDQLEGLVLGGCSANVMGWAAVPFLVQAATFKVLIALFGEPRLIRQNLPMLVKLGMGEPDVQAIVDAGMSLGVFEQVVHALRGIDFRQMLAGIERPVLIVNGSRDKPMLRQEAGFLAAGRQVSGRRIDCEHGVSMLRSAEFAGLVNDFASLAVARRDEAATQLASRL